MQQAFERFSTTEEGGEMAGNLLLSADAARLAGVTPATVRAWERDGKLNASRTPSGVRLFRRTDVEEIVAERVKAAAKKSAA